MQVSAVKSRSPSFDRCSSSTTANNSSQMAARLVEEFGDVFAEFCFFKEEEEEKGGGDEALKSDREEEGEEQFEFAFASVSRDCAPIPADEIFYNGMIRPIYPILDPNSKYETLPNLGPSNLRKLFVEERETASCSSSEADELDGVAADSYCVWRPKAAAEEERFWKKSCSIGSGSKRWKLKSILHRSHSLGSKEGEEEIIGGAKESSSLKHSGSSWKSTFASSPPRRTGDQAAVSQRKLIPPPYKRSDGEKRRPYLPYRQDLVGFLANINVGKKLQPFY